MSSEKRKNLKIKSQLHPRNKHRTRYNFAQLIKTCPKLAPFVHMNDYGDESINFFDPAAVRMLNTALLMHYYDVTSWVIPPNYLCPPIPGRVDYLHYVADLLGEQNQGKIPKGRKIKCLDIGVGANGVYPIIGVKEYGWSFVGSEIDKVAIAAAEQNIQENVRLKGKVEIRHQSNPQDIFFQIIRKNERFDLSICNPPFHASLKEAQTGSIRKLKNLTKQKVKKAALNFGGHANELWCEGGEKRFIREMIRQSSKFSHYCFWFTTLVAKEASLKTIYKALEKVKPTSVKTIPMGQGNKVSRIVAWTFLTAEEQEKWQVSRWK